MKTATAALVGKRVRVYWNSQKYCWSLLVGRKVRAHATGVYLRNATFLVSEAGRQRVLRERRKNVHAYVEGEVVEIFRAWKPLRRRVAVSYNPYKFGTFYRLETNEPVFEAPTVMFQGNLAWITSPTSRGRRR